MLMVIKLLSFRIRLLLLVLFRGDHYVVSAPKSDFSGVVQLVFWVDVRMLKRNMFLLNVCFLILLVRVQVLETFIV